MSLLINQELAMNKTDNNDQHTPKELLNTRAKDRLSLLEKKATENVEVIFSKASSDWGTVLNNGRRGSQFAPTVLESMLLKMAGHPDKNKSFSFHEVTNLDTEKTQFEEGQKSETTKLQSLLDKYPTAHLVHLGGGHDHIFPLFMALKPRLQNKKLFILNIDPHLDTRTDHWHNSGTPFRNIDQNAQNHQVKIYQWGTHLFANGEKNFSGLTHAQMEIQYFDEVKKECSNFSANKFDQILKSIEAFKPDYLLFSLDVDAYDGSCMKAVSAVNHKGFPPIVIEELYEALIKTKIPMIATGIYEYNPMFDDLANSGGRILCSFIYDRILTK